MAAKIVFSPPLAEAILDVARATVPAGRVAAGRPPRWVLPELRG